ncbi:MAG TPA: hypothetical protein IAA19_04240 [Candidatus Olsenella pullistercoris]|uniref:Uncharacterized protein n=1 Tax=Candidatus Olsenella pullistercoris TaxID=2838712 RepID=A0A9D2EZJ8_9ACTN|nr:hypothetical protein [Candidatus Olsenella pullistercoris]
MGLLSGLFGRGSEKTYRWKPLRCMPGDIVDLMRECERIDAPIVGLEVELDDVRQRVGMSSDYERDRGFFDTVWYVDDDEYPSLDAFLANATLGGRRFSDIAEPVLVIRDLELGDPRGNVLLAQREL